MIGNMIMFLTVRSLSQENPDLVTDIQIQGYDRPWYSGYLNLPQGKSFHYVYMPSQSSKKSDPVLLWLNGGPGCSSLIGMLHENGPFIFKQNSTVLQINNHSWNMKANLLYLQSPSNVGFSKGPIESSDQSVAIDNLQAMREFYKKYPQVAKNDLYLSGQSYAGVYIPTLARKIKQQDKNIPLKGIIIGNPCTTIHDCYDRDYHKDYGYSTNQVQFLHKHGFFGVQQWEKYRINCILGYETQQCSQVLKQIDTKFKALKVPINNIYSPCYGSDSDCQDYSSSVKFLNSAATKAALHVQSGITWATCNQIVAQRYKKNQKQGFSQYQHLIDKYRWVFSGDVDANVPITGTKKWVNQLRIQLDLPQIQPWREWLKLGHHQGQDQVAGDVWALRGLTMLSVRGAGHMVPRDKPKAAQQMIQAFISGRLPPFK